MPSDPVQEAMVAAISEDEQFKALIKATALKGVKKMQFLLDYGTPAEQARIATSLARVFERALMAGGDKDDSNEKLHKEMQDMLKRTLVVDHVDPDTNTSAA